MAQSALPARPATSAPAANLNRFFFALGHTALQQLVLVETLASSIRRMRAQKEKAALEEQDRKIVEASRGGSKGKGAAGKAKGGAAEPSEDDDIATQVSGLDRSCQQCVRTCAPMHLVSQFLVFLYLVIVPWCLECNSASHA